MIEGLAFTLFGAVLSVMGYWLVSAYALDVALRFVRGWIRLYTAWAPPARRDRRRGEMEAEIHDHLESLTGIYSSEACALKIVRRALDGSFDDVGWGIAMARRARDEAAYFARVRAEWPRLMEWIGNRTPFVHAYLQPAEPVGYDGEWLSLRFGFRLHYEKIRDDKNRNLVEQGCRATFGRPVKIRCELQLPLRDQRMAVKRELGLEATQRYASP